MRRNGIASQCGGNAGDCALAIAHCAGNVKQWQCLGMLGASLALPLHRIAMGLAWIATWLSGIARDCVGMAMRGIVPGAGGSVRWACGSRRECPWLWRESLRISYWRTLLHGPLSALFTIPNGDNHLASCTTNFAYFRWRGGVGFGENASASDFSSVRALH